MVHTFIFLAISSSLSHLACNYANILIFSSILTWIALVMSMHFYSCRHLLDLQVQRFVEQQQFSLKWITQGLSNSRRKRSKLSLSSNHAITIQKVSCVSNTPNTLVRCIGALVRRRDSKIQAVVMIISNVQKIGRLADYSSV
jgi:hypothetical protein